MYYRMMFIMLKLDEYSLNIINIIIIIIIIERNNNIRNM